jgi:hypothetical protein
MSFLFPFTREFSLHARIIILYEFVLEAPIVEKPCFAQYNPIAGTVESFKRYSIIKKPVKNPDKKFGMRPNFFIITRLSNTYGDNGRSRTLAAKSGIS